MTLLSKTTTRPPSLLPELQPLQTLLSQPIVLSDRVHKSATESRSFKFECSEVVKHVDRLSTMLRTVVRFSTTTNVLYDRPICRIAAQVSRTLLRAYTLVRKCRRRNFLHRLINLVTAADFRKIFSHLEASAADLRWLLSILHLDGENDQDDLVLSLPPIANNDPILTWVWSCTATVQMSTCSTARVEAANEIASLGKDSDRNKKIIIEEGGVPPLLKLLKEGSSIEGQIAASIALYEIANDEERVEVVFENSGIPLIVNVLGDSPIRVRVKVCELVARLAEFDHQGFVKEAFGRENVIRPLVSLLSFETFRDEFRANAEEYIDRRKENLKSMNSNGYSFSSSCSDIGIKGGRRNKENESDEFKELKINCARALWMLAKDSVANARRICETKGLICLAKLVENESGVLQKHCVLAIMEITSVAEVNPDLRRSVFKTSSPAAKVVVEQLLRVIKGSDDSKMKIGAIKSIGSLSRTFPARETQVIGPLVDQLGSSDCEVATEAVISLGKFADLDNFLSVEHSKTIIEFKVVIPLLRLLRSSQRAQIHGLVLLCCLAINASNNEELEQARVLATLRGVEPTLVAQDPRLRALIAKAVYNLDIYHGENRSLRQSSMRI